MAGLVVQQHTQNALSCFQCNNGHTNVHYMDTAYLAFFGWTWLSEQLMTFKSPFWETNNCMENKEIP